MFESNSPNSLKTQKMDIPKEWINDSLLLLLSLLFYYYFFVAKR